MNFDILVNKENIDNLQPKTILRIEQLFDASILEIVDAVISPARHGGPEHTIDYSITWCFNMQNFQMHYTGNMPIAYVTVLMAIAQGHDVDLALDAVEAGVGGFV